MSQYIKVIDPLHEDETTEVPLEDDGTLLLESFKSTFPNAVGLKAKVGEKSSRAVRNVSGVLYPLDVTSSDETMYVVVQSTTNKRSREDDEADEEQPSKQAPKLEVIVLGLPFQESNEGVKAYFEGFGEVETVDIKKHPDGRSKGFGFVVFKEASVANTVVQEAHELGGRHLEVKFPFDRDSAQRRFQPPQPEAKKIFVGKVTEQTTDDKLRKHFEQYGPLADVYVPQNPFRGIAYIEFKQSEDVERALQDLHTVEGIELNIQRAIPKVGRGHNNNNNFGSGGAQRGNHSGYQGGYQGGNQSGNGRYSNSHSHYNYNSSYSRGGGGGGGGGNDQWNNNNNGGNYNNYNSGNSWNDTNQGANGGYNNGGGRGGNNWSQGNNTNGGYNGNNYGNNQQNYAGNNQNSFNNGGGGYF